MAVSGNDNVFVVMQLKCPQFSLFCENRPMFVKRSFSLIRTVAFYNSTLFAVTVCCLFLHVMPQISSRTLETEAGETQGDCEDHRLRQRLSPGVRGRRAQPRGAR